MTRFLALGFAVMLLTLCSARGQSPDDQYLRIYFLVQEGDTFLEQNRAGEALPKFLEAAQALERFTKGYPEWNQDVIKFRAAYVASRIAELQARLGTRAAQTTNTPVARPGATTTQPAPTLVERPEPQNTLLEAQLTALRNELSQLRTDNAELQAKLKEALAAQPAASDPRELEKAEERIRNLQKENELLQATLADAQDPTKRADTNALARAQKSLEEANKELARQREANEALANSKAELEARLKNSAEQAQFASGLRTENELLKKQLAELQTAASQTGTIAQELGKLRLEVAALRSDKDVLENEKRALEERLRSRPAATAAAPVAPPSEQPLTRKERKAHEAELKKINDQVKKIEREREDLRKKLEAANKQLATRKTKGNAARVLELERELAALRDRMAPLEAVKTPYAEAELALMSIPGVNVPSAAQHVASRSASTNAELAASTTALVTDARRHFAAREFETAADKFAQAVQADERNVAALGGLAISEMERNRLDEAEKAIQKAITLAPDNPSVHSTLGQIKYRQKQFDAAYEALSRASALDPNNAEVQNLLGVTLSQKGLRGPAEAALRKAIQLQPGYGSAHNNLAIIYANGQPPLVELARWHYQKAIASGHPRNQELEQMLARNRPQQ